MEEAFIKQGIPYKIIGGIQFYERREIKDLLAYLKLLANPFDRISFMRILNIPSRGLGAKCEEILYELWKNEPFLRFEELIAKAIDQELVPKSKQITLQAFVSLFKDLSPLSAPSHAVELILKRTHYITYLQESCDDQESKERIANIEELISSISYFESQKATTTHLFLEEIALMQEKLAETKETQDMVILMTLHAAKGLEFDTVFLIGLEEGIIPSTRSLQEDANIQEERRLLYVGITRAQEKLILSYAKYRYIYGQMQKQLTSRFVDEIPKHLISEIDCAYWDKGKFALFFTNWFQNKVNSVIPNQKTISTINTSGLHLRKNQNSFQKNKLASKNWYKGQTVLHKKYGQGTIKEIDNKNGQINLTVQFKDALKKIVAQFLE